MENVVVIDAGNTNLKLALLSHGKIVHRYCIERETPEFVDRLKDFVMSMDTLSIGSIVFSCGRVSDQELFQRIHRTHFSTSDCYFVTHGMKTPFEWSYNGGAPGPDRLANAMGLIDLYPSCEALCIDFGTTTHIEVVKHSGEFIGGAILPGITTQFEMLQSKTQSTLPGVIPAEVKDESFPAASTTGAIAAGVVEVHYRGLRDLIRSYHQTLGDRSLKVVLTGGGASAASDWFPECEVVEDLTLMGLYELFRLRDSVKGQG